MTNPTEQAREDALKCAEHLVFHKSHEAFQANSEIITRELALEELYAIRDVAIASAECAGQDWLHFQMKLCDVLIAYDAKKGAAK